MIYPCLIFEVERKSLNNVITWGELSCMTCWNRGIVKADRIRACEADMTRDASD